VQSLRACAEIVVPRTVVIDDAVTGAVQRDGDAQVVLVGAGLDTRPWRLSALSGATVFSVDHPASQADARDRGTALTPLPRRLVFVPVDLTVQPLDAALALIGHDEATPTVWIWEGVVPYLRRADVAATAAALARRSARGSVLTVNYQTPSVVAALGRRVNGLVARAFGADSPTADEPWRSAWTPRDMAGLLAGLGFVMEQDVDLLETASRLGSPTTHNRSLRNGRVAIARFAGPAHPDR
jgi:methyltransferase (TIGR00027 family)